MTMVETLLAEGTVTQDPENTEKVIFNVPIYIKKDAVNAGAFESFAGEYGWTPTIKNPLGEDVDNPMPLYEKCQRIVWAFVSDVFKAALIKKAEAEARLAAGQQIAGFL